MTNSLGFMMTGYSISGWSRTMTRTYLKNSKKSPSAKISETKKSKQKKIFQRFVDGSRIKSIINSICSTNQIVRKKMQV